MKLKLIFLGFLVFLGAASVLGLRWLLNDHGYIASGKLLTVQENCQLDQAPCEATGSGQRRVTINVAPQPLPLMKPIETSVTLYGFEDVISARFQVEGVNMFMGYQHALLTPRDHSPHALSGSFMLPVCSNEVMQWRGTLSIQTRADLFQAHFPFTTTQAITP